MGRGQGYTGTELVRRGWGVKGSGGEGQIEKGAGGAACFDVGFLGLFIRRYITPLPM